MGVQRTVARKNSSGNARGISSLPAGGRLFHENILKKHLNNSEKYLYSCRDVSVCCLYTFTAGTVPAEAGSGVDRKKIIARRSIYERFCERSVGYCKGPGSRQDDDGR
jgi:hypothetical protein